MTTEQMIGDKLLRLRLSQLGYDTGEALCEEGALLWALRWFGRRNGIDPEDAQAMAARLASDEAARGTDAPFQEYSMRDPLWADHPYKAALTQVQETVSTSGCGPTSMAMAVSTLTGRAVLPPVLCDWSNRHHHRDPAGIDGTYDSFFPACAQLYGLKAERYDMEDAQSFEIIREALSAGGVVIANVKSTSPYTTGGHFNLIRALRGATVHIGDPSPRNLEKPDYTIGDWLQGRWATHFFVISKP